MPATFHIVVDPVRASLAIDLSGFFTTADVAGFAEALRAALGRLRCPANQHVTLCDLSRMQIQTQEVVTAFAEVVRNPVTQGRLLAMVVGVSLARHQAQRINTPDRSGVAFFYDRGEAEAWLVSGDRTAALCPHVPASPMSGGHGCTARNAA
ncbi:MAG: hypothetical protein PGN08_13090 [Sphingomonas taxi]